MSELTTEQVQEMLARAEALATITLADVRDRQQLYRCWVTTQDVPLLAREVLRLRKEVRYRRICAVCWQDAWTPVESEADCGLVHPHLDTVHARCECCWLETALREARAQYDQVRESLRWALVHVNPRRAAIRTASACRRCRVWPIRLELDHAPDCPYARALKLLEEKP